VSARDDLIEIVTRDTRSSGGDPVWATDLVDAYRVEVLREATAIAATEQLVDGTGHPRDEGYSAAIDDVVTALTRAADAG
jgi:hypothetical protein